MPRLYKQNAKDNTMHTRKRLTIAYLAMAAALLVLFALNLFWGSVALSAPPMWSMPCWAVGRMY